MPRSSPISYRPTRGNGGIRLARALSGLMGGDGVSLGGPAGSSSTAQVPGQAEFDGGTGLRGQLVVDRGQGVPDPRD